MKKITVLSIIIISFSYANTCEYHLKSLMPQLRKLKMYTKQHKESARKTTAKSIQNTCKNIELKCPSNRYAGSKKTCRRIEGKLKGEWAP